MGLNNQKREVVGDTRDGGPAVLGALLASSSQDLQQEAEQVDNVQVDAEGGEYVFLWAYGVTLVP